MDAVDEPSRAELRAKYLNASMADGKGGSKSTAVRHWLRYCVFGRRVSPMRHLNADSPHAQKLAEEALLMDFAIWLAVTRPPMGGRGRPSVETIVKYISTIKAWHYRHFGYRIGADLELTRLRDLLKGIRREHLQPTSRRRYGVRTQHLAEAMRRGLPLESDDGQPSKLLCEARSDRANWRAALSAGFCGLMRAAELSLQPGESWHPELHLARSDLSFYNDGDGRRFAVIMMRPAKNGKQLRGKRVPLVLASGGTLLDPVADLERLVEEDFVPEEDKETTPLFRTQRGPQGGAFTVAAVRRMVKELMSIIGQDPAFFGAHSLRIGGATAAAAAGVEPAVIRVCGRWSSDIFEIYTRLTQQAAANMTGVIGSTAFNDLERGEFHHEELEILPHELEVDTLFEEEGEED